MQLHKDCMNESTAVYETGVRPMWSYYRNRATFPRVREILYYAIVYIKYIDLETIEISTDNNNLYITSSIFWTQLKLRLYARLTKDFTYTTLNNLLMPANKFCQTFQL
jgi:hypothetical protein